MTISAVKGQTFGHWLCKKMGLDPNQVTKITFVAEPGDVVRVEVAFLVPPELAEAIVRKYVLVDMGGEE